MKLEHKKEIEEVIGKMECPKGFRCYESGPEALFSAKDIGTEVSLEYLKGSPPGL